MNLFNLNTIENKMETSNKINLLFTRKRTSNSLLHGEIKINKTQASFAIDFMNRFNLKEGSRCSFSITDGVICFVHSLNDSLDLYAITRNKSSRKNADPYYCLSFPKNSRHLISKFYGAYNVSQIQHMDEFRIFYLKKVLS